MTRAQVRKGSYSNEGYKPILEIGISLQGVDADHAWEYGLRLATHLKVPVKAEIEWRNNDKAAHPGERALWFGYLNPLSKDTTPVGLIFICEP